MTCEHGNRNCHVSGPHVLCSNPIDVETCGGGSVIGFRACTEAAREWFEANVGTESWQWMGDVLYVDHRCARDIRDGLLAEGLEIS